MDPGCCPAQAPSADPMPKLEQLKQLASELHERKEQKVQATATVTPWATFMEAARGDGTEGLKRSALTEGLGVLDSGKHQC